VQLDVRLQRDMDKKKKRGQTDPEDEEDTLSYMERKKMPFLNEEEGVFAVKDTTSLNTAPSVFDRTAVFRTRG